MRVRHLVTPVAAVMAMLVGGMGCGPDCSAIYLTWSAETDASNVDVQGAANFWMGSDDPGSTFVHAGVSLQVANATEVDCPVAIYASEEPADPLAVWTLDAESAAPDVIEGLGQRVEAANLARQYDETIDTLWTWHGFDADDVENSGVGVSLTVLSCGEPGVRVYAEAETYTCRDSKADVQQAMDTHTASFSLVREF